MLRGLRQSKTRCYKREFMSLLRYSKKEKSNFDDRSSSHYKNRLSVVALDLSVNLMGRL